VPILPPSYVEPPLGWASNLQLDAACNIVLSASAQMATSPCTAERRKKEKI